MGVLIYDDRDPAITYSEGWALAGSDREFNSTTSWSATEGATARVNFTGTAIQVFGTIAGGIGAGTPVSSYAIDDDDAVIFRGEPRLTVQYNQLFFQSPTLSPGQHTLTITNQDEVQLFLDLMIIAPLDEALVTTVTTTATATPSAAPPRTITVTSMVGSPSNALPAGSSAEDSTGQTGANSQKNNTAAIVGGVIGAIVLVLLLAAGFLVWRKRQQKRNIDSDWISPVPARGTIAPFPPPNTQSLDTPNMSQSPYGGTAYPSSYPTSQYQQDYSSSTQFAGQYARANDAPSELAYYGSGGDYNSNTTAYPQTYPSNYSEPQVGPNGRVRVNLD